MKKILNTSMLFFTISIFGCTSTPTSFDYEHSKAYNIARAGGLSSGIEDAELNDSDIADSSINILDTGFVASGYMQPQFGLSSLQNLSVNAISILSQPDSHGSRNSIMAWMPINEADSTESAKDAFISYIKESIYKSMNSLSDDYELVFSSDNNLSYFFSNESWGCPSFRKEPNVENICRLRVKIFEPDSGLAPDFLISNPENKERYIFSGEDGFFYNTINLKLPASSSVPSYDLYSTISKNLPSWSYIYIAPNKSITSDNNKIKFPYLLNSGKSELFIKP